MSVFVDTGVFYAHHDVDAQRHDDAATAVEAIHDGAYGHPFANEYVLDETITLTRRRTRSFDAADTIANRLLGEGSYPNVYELLSVDPDDLAGSLDVFRKYEDHDLSFTDASIIHHCDTRGIDAVLSFDDDFDGLVDRIEPGA